MIKLVKLSTEYEKQYIDMINEWKAAGEEIIPYSISREFATFEEFVEMLNNEEKGINIGNFVPATTYIGYDAERDIVVGAVNIRHYLNDMLLREGGHIGDGVRPSERRKGYATEMIRQALEICKNELKLNRVLMVCNKSNIGSAKSIIKNGGILENEFFSEEENEIIQRYWIDL